MFTQHVQVTPRNQQLVFPLPELGVVPPPLPSEPSPMAPQHLWTSLSPTIQAQARQTILRLLQERLHDSTHP
jgi:hypothetical protein